jgi:hypothetical protein
MIILLPSLGCQCEGNIIKVAAKNYFPSIDKAPAATKVWGALYGNGVFPAARLIAYANATRFMDMCRYIRQ